MDISSVQKLEIELPFTLYLATQSPRRHQILSEMGVAFTPIPNALEEETFPDTGTPQEKAEALAHDKARVSASAVSDGVVLGTDTIVVLDQTILGKPQNNAVATRMLEQLSGKTHQVITSLCLYNVQTRRPFIKSGVAEVTFNNLSASDIDAYVATKSPLDKAGGYGIQDIPPHFLKQVVGSTDTVMGLCSKTLSQMLKSVV